MALSTKDEQYELTSITSEFVKQNIDSFSRIASDIPHEQWVLNNYLYELPDKWLNSFALINKTTCDLVAFIIASTKDGIVHIHKFAVDSAYRAQGLGKYLLHHLENKLKFRGLYKISLFIDPENIGARKFYEKNGFAFICNQDNMCYFQKQLTCVVAIHQPNFFPWQGYFDKIINSDIFVILDDAQLQKTGGGWSNRVQLSISGEAKWVTAPLNRNFHGTATINHINFDERVPWRDKLIKSLELNYKKALFYNDTITFLRSVINYPENNVARYNLYVIRSILHQLKLKAKLVIASDMNITENATERLIVITKKLGGSIYLCGGGSAGYQDDNLFLKAGVELKYQNYKQAIYNQTGIEKFIPGLSIVDALMHCGFEGTTKLLLNKM